MPVRRRRRRDRGRCVTRYLRRCHDLSHEAALCLPHSSQPGTRQVRSCRQAAVEVLLRAWEHGKRAALPPRARVLLLLIRAAVFASRTRRFRRARRAARRASEAAAAIAVDSRLDAGCCFNSEAINKAVRMHTMTDSSRQVPPGGGGRTYVRRPQRSNAAAYICVKENGGAGLTARPVGGDG